MNLNKTKLMTNQNETKLMTYQNVKVEMDGNPGHTTKRGKQTQEA